jgi:hypothetical protein
LPEDLTPPSPASTGKIPTVFLNALCDKYGSDKGALRPGGHPYPWPPHSYADFIERTFDHCRHHIKSVFECGLGTTNPDIACNMAIRTMWALVDAAPFDLMIDDGLHAFDAGVCLLENSFHRLREGGLYSIEDVAVPTLLEYKKYLLAKQFRYEFVHLYRRNADLLDNSLVIIRK